MPTAIMAVVDPPIAANTMMKIRPPATVPLRRIAERFPDSSRYGTTIAMTVNTMTLASAQSQ